MSNFDYRIIFVNPKKSLKTKPIIRRLSEESGSDSSFVDTMIIDHVIDKSYRNTSAQNN